MKVVLLFFIATAAAQTLDKPVQVYVEQGSNVTLQSHQFSYPEQMQEVNWYVELVWDKQQSSIFTGSKLCQIKKGGTNITWDHGPLQFNCANKSLHLFNLQTHNSAIYNVKVTNDNIEYNTYFNLHVIYIPKPQCMVNSFYIAADYCIIEINCTNSKYPNKVMYNGKAKSYFYKIKGGKPHLSETFYTLVDFHGVQKNFSYTYPFNSLCNGGGKAFVYQGPRHARLLGNNLHLTPAVENPDADSDDAYEKAMAVLVIAAIVCVLVILSALLFLCYWRRRLRQRRRRGPQLVTNQF